MYVEVYYPHYIKLYKLAKKTIILKPKGSLKTSISKLKINDKITFVYFVYIILKKTMI